MSLHPTRTPTHLNPYAKPTVELVLLLLAEAYNDESKLDRVLYKLSKEVFADLQDALLELVKKGKLDLDQKIVLANHPVLYQELKKIEREQLHRYTDWLWMGYQVISESLTRSYVNAKIGTYNIYGKTMPNSMETYELNRLMENAVMKNGYVKSFPKIEIRDTNFYKENIAIPWCQDGKVYSDRLYSHVANFEQKLAFVLEEGIQNGKGMEWMQKSWMKLTGSTAYDTARLLKTETMAMWSMATKSSLLEMGVEFVEIVGDAECGGICLDQVGEAVPLREAEIGDLLPPYHPNCACSYVEYIETMGVDEAESYGVEIDEDEED